MLTDILMFASDIQRGPDIVYYAALSFWAQVAIYVVLTLISVGVSLLLAPEPPDLKGDPASSPDLPTIEQGTPFAIIFGRPPRFKSSMILWWGDFSAQEFQNKNGFAGFNYKSGVHVGLSHANVDGLQQMWIDDRIIWPDNTDNTVYNADGATSFNLNLQNFFGGNDRGGGWASGDGTTILYGEAAQTTPLYLRQQQDGDDTPTYRGITSILFGSDTWWGRTPRFALPSYVLKRTDTQHDETAQWYLAKAEIGSNANLNIIHVIRECLVSPIFGRGVPIADIDDLSFKAAADTIFTEGFGISYAYRPQDEPVKEFISALEGIINGYVHFDHSSGAYQIRLIRNDYGALVTYTEDDFEIDVFARPSRFLSPSETRVKYTSIESAKGTIAKDDDSSLQEVQGEAPVTQTFNWPMVTDPTMAGKLAAREQASASRTQAALRLKAKRVMYELERGDVFKITHPHLTLGLITDMTVRVVTIDRGTLEEGSILINVIEESFNDIVVSQASGAGTSSTDPDPTTVTPSYNESISFSADAITVATINESKT